MRAPMHLWPNFSHRLPFCSLMAVMLSLFALPGCGQDAPTPTTSTNTGSNPVPDPIDFVSLTGANFEDPNTSPTCPFEYSCAALPGEPTAHLRAGSCQERHFRVNADGSRTFLNEHERTHRTGGWLTKLTEDNLELSITYSGSRIKSYELMRGLDRSDATEKEYTYSRDGLSAVMARRDDQNILEQTFTYDEQGRLATDFTKRLIEEDGSISRTSRHYQYTGEREREVWRDLDVDGQLSSPDKLQQRHRWNEDGLLESIAQGLDSPTQTLTYIYSEAQRIDGITSTLAEMTNPLYTFTYQTPQLPSNDEEDTPITGDTTPRISEIIVGQNILRLELVRDESLTLQRVQLLDGEDRLAYEVELEGSSCDRTIHTWIRAMDHYWRDAQPPAMLGQ